MIALGWIYWLVYMVASAVLEVVGLVILWPLARLRLWYSRPSRSAYYAGRTVTAWRGGFLLAPWNNEEDGVAGAAWYLERYASTPAWRNAYDWSAWRNSSNGLRQFPGAMFAIDATKIVVKYYSWGYVARQGWRQYVRIGAEHFGWNMQPPFEAGYLCWPVIGKA